MKAAPTPQAPWIVTATPPTPNGDLHVGHLSGPYLAADIFTRTRRQHGEPVLMVSSGDDNQTYVVTTAERLGVDPMALADQGNADINATLEMADIAFDVFDRPDPARVRRVQAFFHALFEGGALVEKDVDAFYDPVRARYLFEAYVGGGCPTCLAPTKGSICEACGHPNDPATLIDPTVTGAATGAAGAVLERRRVRQLFLPVEAYRDRIAAFYGRIAGTWRPHLPALVDELLAEPLADYPLTYPSSWGVPAGLPGWDGHVWNVWAEMHPGLMHSTALAAERAGLRAPGGDWWREDTGSRLVQFLGFDNSYFFAIAHLALSFAADDCGIGPVVKPHAIVTNEFFRLENRKFSTSQGHAIWGRDLLARASVDVVRFYLCLANPETLQTNFVESEMRNRMELELLRPFAALEAALAGAVDRFGPVEASQEAPFFVEQAARRLSAFQSTERFSLTEQAELILSFIHHTTAVLERAAAPEDLAAGWHAVGALAVFAGPLMPRFAARLADHCGHRPPPRWSETRPAGPARPLPADLLGLESAIPADASFTHADALTCTEAGE
ncbi:MAG TPA: class I tRNA ligase family protein [Arenibaculum sp.]|nr:class I tRNA ligase family protein [Arenibaculum sp.]